MYNQFFTIKPRISEKNGGSKVVHLIRIYRRINNIRNNAILKLNIFPIFNEQGIGFRKRIKNRTENYSKKNIQVYFHNSV